MLPLVSADSHVVEPPDLWTMRMSKRWGDRIPRVEPGPSGARFICEDVPPFGIGAFSAADVDGEEMPARFSTGYERVRPGAWDPALRVRDQERDGVVAEVIYPSLALQLFRIRDPRAADRNLPRLQRLAAGLLRRPAGKSGGRRLDAAARRRDRHRRARAHSRPRLAGRPDLVVGAGRSPVPGPRLRAVLVGGRGGGRSSLLPSRHQRRTARRHQRHGCRSPTC